MGAFDQSLPGRQTDQRDRCRLLGDVVVGLGRDIVFIHSNELRETADAVIARARIDFVSHFELLGPRSNPSYDAGHVVAQHKRHAVTQDRLELTTFDFGVELVQTCGVNLDQNIVVPKLGLWHFAKPHWPFLLYAK